MDCPICKTTISDIKENIFCPVCHWELAVLPTNALGLSRDYEQRLNVFSGGYEHSDSPEYLSQKIKFTQEKNESIKKELKKLEIELKEKTKILERLEKEQITLQKGQAVLLKKQVVLKELEQEIEGERSRLKELLAMDEKVKELKDAFQYPFRRGFSNKQKKLVKIKKFLELYNEVTSGE